MTAQCAHIDRNISFVSIFRLEIQNLLKIFILSLKNYDELFYILYSNFPQNNPYFFDDLLFSK